MISDSQSLFLHYLSDFLHGRPSAAVDQETDWDELFRIARSQDLEAVLYRQCRELLPREIKVKYLRPYVSHAAVSIHREKTLEELAGYAERESIPLIFMKGSVLRDYYPIPALRRMGDIDVIIKEKDRTAFDLILRQQMGFDRFIDNHAVWTYWKDKLYIEVHTHMFYEELANRTDYRSYFDQVWENCHRSEVFGIRSDNVYIPDQAFHFLYIMAHTAKHIVNKGIGFRAYIDMILMCRECTELNWGWIEQELTRLNLLTFTKTCMSLCGRWFDQDMPLKLDDPDDEFYGLITEKTFQDGLFGLENIENEPASAAKYIKQSKEPYYFSAIKRAVYKLFPPYKEMQLIPWYSFVDGKPWLMPVAWIYRFYYSLTHKLKYGTEILTEPFVKKKEVLRRQSYLEKWGL